MVQDFRLDLFIIVGITDNAASDTNPINLKAFFCYNLPSDSYLSLSAKSVVTRRFSVGFHVFLSFMIFVCHCRRHNGQCDQIFLTLGFGTNMLLFETFV